MKQSWQSDVVDCLCDLKRSGFTFNVAWSRALSLYPARGRDMGPERPTLLDRDESVVAFFRRACEDAWHGRRPSLQHFHPSLLMGEDRSGPAVRQRRLAA